MRISNLALRDLLLEKTADSGRRATSAGAQDNHVQPRLGIAAIIVRAGLEDLGRGSVVVGQGVVGVAVLVGDVGGVAEVVLESRGCANVRLRVVEQSGPRGSNEVGAEQAKHSTLQCKVGNP